MEGGVCMVFISNSVCLLYVHVCTCAQACECLQKPEEDDGCLTLLLPVYFVTGFVTEPEVLHLG